MSERKQEAPIAERYAEQKHCCSGCAVKRRCSICDAEATTACADCAIDLRVTVYVCRKRECRDAHDSKCPHELKAALSASEQRERVINQRLDSMAHEPFNTPEELMQDLIRENSEFTNTIVKLRERERVLREENERIKHLLSVSEDYRRAYADGKYKLYAMGGEICEAAAECLPMSEGPLERAVRKVLSAPDAALAPEQPAHPCVCGHTHRDDGSCTVCRSCIYTPEQPAAPCANCAKLQWQPITPENLPKVGDETWIADSFFKPGLVDIVTDSDREYASWAVRGTHFRPINPPAPCEQGKEPQA